MRADFSLLRLLLALSVVLSHHRELTANSGLGLRGISSTVAVQAFFVVSGWVIAASYASSEGPTSAFLARRFARLYPLCAFVVIVQATAALAAAKDTTNELHELGRYLLANLSLLNFLKPSLFGLFSDAHVTAINPSLWTLKIEVFFYLATPVCFWVFRRRGVPGMVAVLLASSVFSYGASFYSAELARQAPGQLRFFIAGMLCWHYSPRLLALLRSKVWLVLLMLVGAVLAQRFDNSQALLVLQPFFVAMIVLGGGFLLPSIERWPDLSYGVYLIHAPLIQFASHYGLVPDHAWTAPLIMLATLVLAALVSPLIEVPAIALGRRVSNRLSERMEHRSRALPPIPVVPRS